jgi:hypothetical protein
VEEEVTWQRLLRDALAALALPPDEQAYVTMPGCVTCELREDFEHARIVAFGNAKRLSEGQNEILNRIDATVRGMQAPDFECFNNEAVRRPMWQQLRNLAAEALKEFGWEGATLQPFSEVRPLMWQRPNT